MAEQEAPVRQRRRPPDLSIHTGTVKVFRSRYGQEGSETVEEIAVPIFNTAPAEVEVTGGFSKEVNDRTWVKVGVTVRLPCYPELSEIERAGAIASRKVEAMIRREMFTAGLLEKDQGPA